MVCMYFMASVPDSTTLPPKCRMEMLEGMLLNGFKTISCRTINQTLRLFVTLLHVPIATFCLKLLNSQHGCQIYEVVAYNLMESYLGISPLVGLNYSE